MPKAKIKRLYLIPILSKGLDVLELLEQVHGPVSLEDVYKQTNISKTSVYRILKTLLHRGYVAQTQNGQYRLVARPRRLRFGFAVQSADLPFSQAVSRSVTAAAASAGIELLILDNRFDTETAVRNAEEFAEKRVDLVLEFQAEESVGPRIANILKKADIPVIAIDVPHPNSTYFGVDNFECGFEAGTLLAFHAQRKWKGHVDWVLGVGFNEAGSFVQSRITGAFEAVKQRLRNLPPERFVQIDGRGSRNPSRLSVGEFLVRNPGSQRILVAAATDSSALGVLDAARQHSREHDIAVVGQDCIPDALEEMRSGQSALVGSVSHEADTYGPRLIQLGVSMLRGHAVPPYNYVRHKVVTPETLNGGDAAGS
ncbi:MAG TPA: substrate-binding domain-containing protein [Terracidiphilus sp.]|nr:substrate-binding domain-containing protein [Terracidiphilus sp.]